MFVEGIYKDKKLGYQSLEECYRILLLEKIKKSRKIMGVYWSLLEKQSSSQCVTVTDLKRDDSILILDDEQDALSLNTSLVNG